MNLEAMNGLLLINKDSGCTSHDVVKDVRRILYSPSVGHCGTLDPLASGLMVLLVGKATRLSKYILEEDKGYQVRAQFGLTTDTQDITGKVLTRTEIQTEMKKENSTKIWAGGQVGPELESLVLSQMVGELELPVPAYSAVKINGKKLYQYARAEQVIELPLRKMHFYDVHMEGFGDIETGDSGRYFWADFRLKCSKGSFVRAWVHELGQKTGYGAVVSRLCRNWSSPYSLQNSVSVAQLRDWIKSGKELLDLPSFTPMSYMLPEWPVYQANVQDVELISHGQLPHRVGRELLATHKAEFPPHVKILSPDAKKLMALVGVEKEKGFVIRNVFN